MPILIESFVQIEQASTGSESNHSTLRCQSRGNNLFEPEEGGCGEATISAEAYRRPSFCSCQQLQASDGVLRWLLACVKASHEECCTSQVDRAAWFESRTAQKCQRAGSENRQASWATVSSSSPTLSRVTSRSAVRVATLYHPRYRSNCRSISGGSSLRPTSTLQVRCTTRAVSLRQSTR